MNTNGKSRPYMISLLAMLVSVSPTVWTPAALAEGPPAAKAPEVSTTGTRPYLGPLPEELAKLARMEAAPKPAALPAKEPAVLTITTGGSTLTSEERAKLAQILAIPLVLPMPDLSKLDAMQTLTPLAFAPAVIATTSAPAVVAATPVPAEPSATAPRVSPKSTR